MLVLPADLTTGSSIMPQKRNPDLFELTRARAAALDGDLVTVLQLKAKLTSGYHRDFQLLKEPLFRGLDRTGEMLAMMAHAVPKLSVDRERGLAALRGEAVVTDEVMRRVEDGVPFRPRLPGGGRGVQAGRHLPRADAGGPDAAAPGHRQPGEPGLSGASGRGCAAQRSWNRGHRARFARAMARLAGRGA